MGAIILPVIIGSIFWALQYHTDFNFFVNMSIQNYWFLGAASGCLAVLGDLCESFLKRAAGIKDSGKALGEHGGFFDRIDSMLLNAPFYCWYVLEY